MNLVINYIYKCLFLDNSIIMFITVHRLIKLLVPTWGSLIGMAWLALHCRCILLVIWIIQVVEIRFDLLICIIILAWRLTECDLRVDYCEWWLGLQCLIHCLCTLWSDSDLRIVNLICGVEVPPAVVQHIGCFWHDIARIVQFTHTWVVVLVPLPREIIFAIGSVVAKV